MNTGARLRDYHLARQLARRAAVTYFGLSYPGDPVYTEANDGLPPPEAVFERFSIVPKARAYTPANLLRGLIGPTPVTLLNCTTEAIARALAELGREMAFDAIQMEGVHLARYLPVLRAFPHRPPVLCDWHNIESELMRRYSETVGSLPRRLYGRRTAGLVERVEAELLRACDAHSVVSGREKAKLQAIVPTAEAHVVENGVDTAYHGDAALDSAYTRWREAGHGAGPHGRRDRIVFAGSMDYHANAEAASYFAREIWPLVRGRCPELRYTIVGRSPGPEVLALAGQPGIEVTGTVPDVRPYYREALVVVVPVSVGSGTRLKILEAMAAGVPVVSTALGAEGLATRPGENILIADSAQDMAEAAVRLRDSPDLWQALRAGGRELVAGRYDWAAVGARLFAIYENAAQGAAARR